MVHSETMSTKACKYAWFTLTSSPEQFLENSHFRLPLLAKRWAGDKVGLTLILRAKNIPEGTKQDVH